MMDDDKFDGKCTRLEVKDGHLAFPTGTFTPAQPPLFETGEIVEVAPGRWEQKITFYDAETYAAFRSWQNTLGRGEEDE